MLDFSKVYSHDVVAAVLREPSLKRDHLSLWRNREHIFMPVIKSGRGGAISYPLLAVYELAMLSELLRSEITGRGNEGFPRASLITGDFFKPYHGLGSKELDETATLSDGEWYGCLYGGHSMGWRWAEGRGPKEGVFRTHAERLFDGDIVIDDPPLTSRDCTNPWFAIWRAGNLLMTIQGDDELRNVFRGIIDYTRSTSPISVMNVTEMFARVDITLHLSGGAENG